MNTDVLAGTRLESWHAYALVFSPVLGYLAAVALGAEFAFIHVLLGTGIFVLGLVNFELSFLIIPLALTNPYPIIEEGFNLTFSEFALLIIFLVWCLRILTGEYPTEFPRRFLYPAAFIVGASILSLAAARFLVPAALQVIRYVEILLFLFVLVVDRCRTPETIYKVCMSLWVGGLIACAIGLFEFATGLTEENEAGRIFLWHGGGYGALVATTLWMSFCFVLLSRRTRPRLVALFAIPLASVVLILSQTRTWIAAFVLVAFLTFILLRKKGLMKLVTVFGLALTLLVVLVQTNFFGIVDEEVVDIVLAKAFRFGVRGGEYSFIDLSLLIRFNVWFHGIKYFLSSPLTGVGVGNLRFDDYFTGHLAAPSEYSGYVDNQYIQGFAEMGIIGGVAWIVYVLRGIKTGRSAAMTTKNELLYPITVGLFGSVLILAVGSIFWVITPHHELFGILVLAFGLLFNISRMQINEGSTPRR